MVHTSEELKQWQSLPLDVKVMMSCDRIREWVKEYGEDGVYISFSGGKDSTVLLDLVRNRCGYKNIQALFVDVPTQYPELRDFVKTFDNVEIIKPKMNFMEVCSKYGFPLISKEVSQKIYETKSIMRNNDRSTWESFVVYRHCLGLGDYEKSNYTQKRWLSLLDAPFNISHMCCKVMKKQPSYKYEKKTGKKPILGTMACESSVREQQWKKYGCNSFDNRRQRSLPMSFWTENDVLQYIYEYGLPICSVYGEVVKKSCEASQDDNIFSTTGVKRTGCMLCGFGCHLKNELTRFQKLKETHPKMYAMLDIVKSNGVSMREAIEWMNKNSNTNIKL